MKPIDVVLDLETLGLVPGCIILQIGAVATDENNSIFDKTIAIDSSIGHGLTIDQSTYDWWMQQDRDVRTKVFGGTETLLEVLLHFKSWIQGLQTVCDENGESHRDVLVWGNGSDFDNTILAHAYTSCFGMQPPWNFRNNRCLRTFRAMLPEVERIESYTKHDALEDAKAELLTLKLLQDKLGEMQQIYNTVTRG